MPSAALADWQGESAERIRQLLSHHEQLGGRGRGRRVGLDQLNWAAVVRIAAEWQDFCRKLHLEATEHWVAVVARPFGTDFEDALTVTLTQNLGLDRGSAGISVVQQDFGRLGINLLQAVKARSSRNQGRLKHLERLHYTRHALAHNDPGKLADVTPVHKADVLRWWNAADRLGGEFDRCAAQELARLLGAPSPW